MRYFILLIFVVTTGCSNIYEGLANKTSDEAIYQDVQTLMDDQDWDTALTKLASLSSSYASKTEVRETWAGVLAGKCGLNFINYFQTLGSVDLSGTTLFKYFMNAFTGSIVSPESCTQAQAKMEEISTDPTARTSGQNLFMAVLGMVKMGVYLRSYLDQNGTDNLGDGSVDGTKNVCTNDASNLPDAALDEIITGFGLLTTNLTTITGVISSGSASTSLSSLNTVCTAVSGVCNKTSTSSISASDRNNFRDLLNTSSANTTAPVGVGACANATVTPCC